LTDLTKRLEQLIEPLAEQHGVELVAVEQAGGRHTPVIRVLLDREGGIDIDAICEANRWVAEVLDSADPISGPYTLEVSSPGVDRPLCRLADFDRFTGETATLKAKPAGQGARSVYTGTIVGTKGSAVVLDIEDEQVTIEFDDIIKARLKGVVTFDTTERGAS
jgi:ribosome maturation factor RimP